MGYAELHCHTNFSFLDGASHPEDLVEQAVRLDYQALAVTDHDGFYGLVKFWQAAREAGIPAVYGVEIGLPEAGVIDYQSSVVGNPLEEATSRDHKPRTDNWELTTDNSAGPRRGRRKRMHGSKPIDPPSTNHLILLASSPQGYAALSRLVTRAQFRGKKDAPRYIWSDLANAAEQGELYALTGCWQGAIPRAAQRGDLDGALRAAAPLRELFGRRLHIELWHHRMPEDDVRNDVMWEVGRRLQLPVVATNNVHYAHPRDADLSEVLAAIGGRRSLDEGDGNRPATNERYLKSPEEMYHRFTRYPGAVERAGNLGRRLAFDLHLVAPQLPDFPMPGHFRDEMAYLRHLTFEGASDVYPGRSGGIDPQAVRRLEHELDVIERLGFPGYFLVVWDIVNFARSQDIYCQIRGSGADSAVCRCLGLTKVDPIRLHLPFERFLSEERAARPT